MADRKHGTLARLIDERMQSEDWPGALRLAAEHVDQVGSDPDLSWTVGWANYQMGTLADAASHLQRANRLEPNNPATLGALGVVLRDQQRYAEAEEVLRAALGIRDDHLSRVVLANLLVRLGKYAEAEAVHREGIALQPMRRERMESLAHLLHDLGKKQEADALYARARELPTRHATTRNKR